MTGKRILFAVPPARFDEAQLYQTWQILADMGAWLTLACDSPTGVAVGEGGAVERISRTLSDADPSRFDAVVFVAGDWKGRAKEPFERFVKAGVPVAAFRRTGVDRLAQFIADLSVMVGLSDVAAQI